MQVSAAGSFEVKASFEPPFHDADGVKMGQARFDKVFAGDLVGTSEVRMVWARTADPKKAAYVALERIEGTLVGKSGSFVVTHTGHMNGEENSLELTIVAGAATGELQGLSGSMTITNEGGAHSYTLRGEL